MQKSKLALLLATVVTLRFMGCKQEPEHVHTFSDTWSFHETSHWKECSVCGEKRESNHNYISKINGWQRCKDCDRKSTTPVSLDTLGTYDSEKKTFGVYPQIIKADTVTVDKTVKNTEITGADYYLGSDGAWYAECVENAYGTGEQYKYSTGNIVSKKDANSVKYFKVAPIEWVYLAETKCLHAKKILIADVQWDASGSNNYANSSIRSWLNGTFYDSAFTENQKKKIKTTTVDNSAASTTDAEKNFPQAIQYCEDTQDKIFLLSEKEATTEGNGFTAYNVYGEGNSRIRFPTDYALANSCYKRDNLVYGGWWWLRSPSGSNCACDIYCDGNASDSCDVSYKSGGVVPALSIDE